MDGNIVLAPIYIQIQKASNGTQPITRPCCSFWPTL